MKIVIFTENNKGGGMDTFIASLVKNWPNKDKFIVICNHNHPGLNYLKDILPKNVEVKTHLLPLNWSFLSSFLKYLPMIIQRMVRQILRPLLAPYQYKKIKKILKNYKADQLISVNGSYPGGETCRLANIAWFSLYKKKSVHNFHNYPVNYRAIFAPYELLIDRKLNDSCSDIVSVSSDCAESIRIRSVFRNSKKISFIYNGLYNKSKNNISSSVRQKFGLTHDSKIILMIGTFEPRKGHKYLIDAMEAVFQAHRDITLFIIGSGTPKETADLKLLISKFKWNHKVHFTGFIPDISEYMSVADIVVIPSQEHESFGLTAIEAMSYAVPIVSTNVGGLPETIGENGYCGFRTDKENMSGFSKNIICLIRDASLAKKMGLNGLTRVNKLFTADRMAKEYQTLLQKNI
tara:strand:+ start:3433 stop:4647 length:1215 start_codon:yes stop_codon:yes gene_type:complete